MREPQPCPYEACEEVVTHSHGTDMRYLRRRYTEQEMDDALAGKPSPVTLTPPHAIADVTSLGDLSGPEPTKQREGDQVLPSGGQECVQDVVIARMEESKRVDLERYGSTLMTFNGRKGIQDVAEEIRDLFVYITQIEMEAQASRETLIDVVTEALTGQWLDLAERRVEDSPQGHCKAMAEVAVDRIMGWVVGQREGSS